MKLESDVFVSALVALERQLAALRRHSGELAAAFGRGDPVPAALATTKLRRVLDGLAVTIATLKPQVVGFDRERAGEAVESLGELALRAATLVVAAQVDQVCDALRDAAAPARARALFAGRFRNADDVAAFVHAELARINGTWMPHRRGSAPQPCTLYRQAIRAAQQAVVAIGQDPDFARFLHEGATFLDWPEVRTGCIQITVVIGIKLEAEPDPWLFQVPPYPPRPRDRLSTREP